LDCVVTASHYKDGTNTGMPVGLARQMRTNQVKMEAKVGADMKIVHDEIMNAKQEK
jgi:hypothetical protein